jgi:formylglycine-generating enzyme required for sulfatase activity
MKTNPCHNNPNRRASIVLLVALCLATQFSARAGSPPVVTAVTAAQAALPSKDVNISYTISDPDSTSANVYVIVSSDSGNSWVVNATNFSGNYGPGMAVTATPTTKSVVWHAGTDWDGNFSTHCRVRVIACDNGMVLIPAGSYLRGNPPALGDSDITDAPQYPVFVNAFLMDSNLVSGGLWSSVYSYALTNGYTFDNAGSFKGANQPVQSINWYDAIRWCNARSEMEGLHPFYEMSVDGGATWIAFWARQGYPDPNTSIPGILLRGSSTGANSYRLPTEAEWEKAARGGATGHRFPWSDTDHISESRANYLSDSNLLPYDDSNTGNNPTYATGSLPYTSPVGSFAANGYGLYDMAGNTFEWCGDWYGSYTFDQTNPQGPSSGSYRVVRGGCWNFSPGYARCAFRNISSPEYPNSNWGFRCVRGF